MIAEYWQLGPHTVQPPGNWALFAQYVSARDHHTLDDDVKMFFALTNAIFHAGIAAWGAKRVFDSVRPVTAIPYLFHGQQISVGEARDRALSQPMAHTGFRINRLHFPHRLFPNISQVTARSVRRAPPSWRCGPAANTLELPLLSSRGVLRSSLALHLRKL